MYILLISYNKIKEAKTASSITDEHRSNNNKQKRQSHYKYVLDPFQQNQHHIHT